MNKCKCILVNILALILKMINLKLVVVILNGFAMERQYIYGGKGKQEVSHLLNALSDLE